MTMQWMDVNGARLRYECRPRGASTIVLKRIWAELPARRAKLGIGLHRLGWMREDIRSFIAGEDTFAHSLAVAEEGRVIAAVVYLPALDRLYTAASTCPALRDGQPIRASTCAAAEGATLLTTQHMLGADYWPGGVPQVKRSFRASLAFRLCLVAEGRHDGMVTLRDAWEWDIAAGALIVQQAGALATDRFGKPLRFNAERPLAPGVLAAGAALHAELLGRLTG